MKELLQQYAAYNCWANRRLTDTILQMDELTHQKLVPNSFNNLYATVLHMWDAESIWWQRMKLHERLLIPSQTFNPDMKEAVNGLMSQSALWEEFVASASEIKLEHVFEYKNSHKEIFRQPVSEVLIHLFNHGTYHRGQLVTMMHALGHTKIPATDFIVWSRKRR